MSSSRPQSGATFNPSDFATAFNTPTLGTPALELGQDGANVSPTPSTPVPRNVHTPLPATGSDALVPPKALGSVSNLSSNRDSYGPSPNNSHLLAGGQVTDAEKEGRSPSKRSRRPMFFLAALAALIVIVLAVILPVYFTVIKKKGGSSASANNGSSPSSTGGGSGSPSSAVTTGGDGSIVTTETGEQFTYRNPFGGFCECSILLPHAIPGCSHVYQGCRILTIPSIIMLKQTPGLLLLTLAGIGEPTKYTGTSETYHYSTHSSYDAILQCKSGRSICSRAVHLAYSIPKVSRCNRRVDSESVDGC